jgi:hypothetical protein
MRGLAPPKGGARGSVFYRYKTLPPPLRGTSLKEGDNQSRHHKPDFLTMSNHRLGSGYGRFRRSTAPAY